MYSEREALVETLSTVQIVLDDHDIPVFGRLDLLRSSVSVLRDKIESYELWGVENQFSPLDDDVLDLVRRRSAQADAAS